MPVHVYAPRGVGFAPGIVIVHGMHRLGIDEPRLVSFARALAASGFFVMTPMVPGIADYRVERESADLIGTAARSFAQELNVPKVGILAISFSGGLSLLAASDPQYSQSIAWVASVGGYYDLAHVLRFFATGEAVRPDGSVQSMQPHEYGPLIVIYDEPQDFFAPQDADGTRGPQAAARRTRQSFRSADQDHDAGRIRRSCSAFITSSARASRLRFWPKSTSVARSWLRLLPPAISSP